MTDERVEVPRHEVVRWLVVAVLLVAGIAAFQAMAHQAEPLVSSTAAGLAP